MLPGKATKFTKQCLQYNEVYKFEHTSTRNTTWYSRNVQKKLNWLVPCSSTALCKGRLLRVLQLQYYRCRRLNLVPSYIKTVVSRGAKDMNTDLAAETLVLAPLRRIFCCNQNFALENDSKTWITFYPKQLSHGSTRCSTKFPY